MGYPPLAAAAIPAPARIRTTNGYVVRPWWKQLRHIDCGPDFRQQIMNQPFRRIDGILITHAHYDHMGGMDDIRPYCQFGEINVYADPLACQGMLQMLPYCFAEHRYPGVPAIQLHEIRPHEPFRIGDIHIMPFQVMHHDLPILGYRLTSDDAEHILLVLLRLGLSIPVTT